MLLRSIWLNFDDWRWCVIINLESSFWSQLYSNCINTFLGKSLASNILREQKSRCWKWLVSKVIGRDSVIHVFWLFCSRQEIFRILWTRIKDPLNLFHTNYLFNLGHECRLVWFDKRTPFHVTSWAAGRLFISEHLWSEPRYHYI